MAKQQRPTLAQVRRWPPTVNVEEAALALGVSRASLYNAIAADECPVETVLVGHRRKVLTHSLVGVLEGNATRAAAG